MHQLGVIATAIGEVVPYSMANEKTGEMISGLNLRVPGGTVGLQLAPEIVSRMNAGEVWQVTGPVMVSKAKGQLRIYNPTELRRLAAVATGGGPKVVFDLPAGAK